MFSNGTENKFKYNQSSNNLSFIHLSSHNYEDNQSCNSLDDSLCPFCPKLFNVNEAFIMLNNALYQKYSSSQNYFYKKEIDKFYCEKVELAAPTRKKISEFNNLVSFNERNEYLLQYFEKNELSDKLGALVEYYKYHNEVPRLFFKKLMRTIYKFYNKKRKIQFQKLQQLLHEQSKHSVDNQNSKITLDYSLVLKSKYFDKSRTQKTELSKITKSQFEQKGYSSFFNKTLFSILNEDDHFFTPKGTPKLQQRPPLNGFKLPEQKTLKANVVNISKQQVTQKQNPFQKNIEQINTELNQIFPKNRAFIGLFWQVLSQQMKLHYNKMNKIKNSNNSGKKEISSTKKMKQSFPKTQQHKHSQMSQNQFSTKRLKTSTSPIRKLVQKQKNQMIKSKTASPNSPKKKKDFDFNSLTNLARQQCLILNSDFNQDQNQETKNRRRNKKKVRQIYLILLPIKI